MLRSILLTLGLASIGYSMTTPSGHHGHHHGTHAPNTDHPEKGTISFFYDSNTHYLAGKTTSSCYIWPLHSTQQQLVHTEQGLEMLELAMIKLITGGEAMLQNSDLGSHSRGVLHFCRNHKMYDLGVKSTSAPTAAPTFMALP
ncbi:uncharacterized protein [Argopecten irradians]|uniref:uncharacterized protein n=1 Tax=Argopecten irradians TaxID=31199 RepID=UPI003713E997